MHAMVVFICTLLPSYVHVHVANQAISLEYLFTHANGIYTIACHNSLVVFSIPKLQVTDSCLKKSMRLYTQRQPT